MIRIVISLGMMTAGLASAAPLPKVANEGQLLVVFEDGSMKILDPEGKRATREIALDRKDGTPTDAKLSPDGKRLAFMVKARPDSKDVQFRIRDLEVTGESTVLHTVQHAAHWFFSPDSKTLYGSGLDFEAARNPNKFRHECWINWSIDVGTGKVSAIELGGEYRILGIDRTGDRFATIRTFDLRPVGNGVRTPSIETHRTDRKTLKHELAIPVDADLMPQFTLPDGDRWLVRRDPAKRTLDRMAIYSAKAGSTEEMVDSPDVPVHHIVVSPDGKRLAYAKLTKRAEATEILIVVADVNGKNPHLIHNSSIGVSAILWK